jgi:hypothetical protein
MCSEGVGWGGGSVWRSASISSRRSMESCGECVERGGGDVLVGVDMVVVVVVSK